MRGRLLESMLMLAGSESAVLGRASALNESWQLLGSLQQNDAGLSLFQNIAAEPREGCIALAPKGGSMKSLQNRLKAARENKGGFTLVEIVVVLVIIAILATLMLGAYNGYIDKAKEKTLTADTRSLYLAAQTIAAEEYAATGKTMTPSAKMDDILALADLTNKADYTATGTSGGASVKVDDSGKVTEVSLYSNSLKKTCTITASTGTATIQ